MHQGGETRFAEREGQVVEGVDEIVGVSIKFVGKSYVDSSRVEGTGVRARRVIDPWSSTNRTLGKGRRCQGLYG